MDDLCSMVTCGGAAGVDDNATAPTRARHPPAGRDQPRVMCMLPDFSESPQRVQVYQESRY